MEGGGEAGGGAGWTVAVWRSYKPLLSAPATHDASLRGLSHTFSSSLYAVFTVPRTAAAAVSPGQRGRWAAGRVAQAASSPAAGGAARQRSALATGDMATRAGEEQRGRTSLAENEQRQEATGGVGVASMLCTGGPSKRRWRDLRHTSRMPTRRRRWRTLALLFASLAFFLSAKMACGAHFRALAASWRHRASSCCNAL